MDKNKGGGVYSVGMYSVVADTCMRHEGERRAVLRYARILILGGLFALLASFGASVFAESRYIDVGLWYGRLSPTWVTLASDEPYHVVIMREKASDIGSTRANGRDGDKRYSLPLTDASGNALYRVGLEPYRGYYVELEPLASWRGDAGGTGASGSGSANLGSANSGSANLGSANSGTASADRLRIESEALSAEYAEKMAYYRQSGLTPVLVYEEYPAIGVLFANYEEAVRFTADSGFGGTVVEGANCFLVTGADDAGVALLSALNLDAMVYARLSDMGCSQADKVHPYRGGFRYTLGSAGYFSFVNRVDIEEYLYGVVPVEMSASWHIESLKAQAVAARNYAVVPSGKYTRFGFDVDDSVASQAYGGYAAEHYRSTEAVDGTRGEYMLYEGKVIQMFFNASSGGYLDSAKNIWGGEDLPYLKPKPDPYSAGYTWTYELTPSFMEEVVAEMGQYIGEVSGIEILSRTESGRVAKMRLFGQGGSFETTGERFKAVVNSRKFKSSLFTFDEAYAQNIFRQPVDFEILKKEGVNSSVSGSEGDFSSSGSSSSGDASDGASSEGAFEYPKISDIVGGAVSENPPSYDPKNDAERMTQSQSGGQESQGESKSGRYELDLPESETAYFLNDRILIYGHGYGHGIGLSQLGAVKMAELGKKYTEILEFYYNQVESIRK